MPKQLLPRRSSEVMMRNSRVARLAASFLFPLAALLLQAEGSTAQEAPGSDPLPALTSADLSHESARPLARAIRTEQPIVLDGRLDDPVWAAAPVISTFTQIDPDEGAPVSQRTEVRIAYDDQALYIGAMLYDTGPITTRLARRDASMDESDAFAVLIDSYHDHQTAYRFATNPSGMKQDAVISSGGTDASWDPVWAVETDVSAEGWSVEMRIPFSQLRFSPDEQQSWGLQLQRDIRRNQEVAVFAFTPKLERSGVHRYGHLEGIRGIQSGRRLELLPYMTGRAEYLRPRAVPGIGFDNPYREGSNWVSSAGLDLKYSVSSNLTLDATVNPDFGQVEVDPAIINLTAFESRFEEKRPFFIEGAEIFRFAEGGPRGSVGNMPEALYSRRIGRAPQGVLPSSAIYSDVPTSTAILGAAKLTGKIGEGWSVGLLEAVTGRESAVYVDATGADGTVVIEPNTNYLVARARRDMRNGNTRVGAMTTAVNRDLADAALAGRLHAAAYSGGIDLIHSWDDRSWRFNSAIIGSWVEGDPLAILRTQRASTRYFHRPDASHLEVDPTATSMGGIFAMGLVEKEAGTWTGRLGFGTASPGYEVNDLGFQTGADRIYFDTHLQYNETTPGRTFRNWAIFGGPNGVWNYAGNYLVDNTNLNIRGQLLNYWSGSFRVSYLMERYDDRLTRGGPLARTPQGWEGRFSMNSDSRGAYVLRMNGGWAVDEAGSWNRSVNLSLNYKPRDNWEIQIGPELARSHGIAQYVATVADSLAVSTHRSRYIFAGLDHTTVGIETRTNVTFTPALSLQLYAQPFLSSGRYGALKELAAPRTFDFLVYGEDTGTIARQADGNYRINPDGEGPANPFTVRSLDFNVRSLRGNAVLRWEWRPGSTLYLVWQQQRENTLRGLGADPSTTRIGDFDFGRDTRALFDVRPDNIFAIKINYWLNP